MSDDATPRTDACLAHLNLPDGTKVGVPTILTDLARQLERELVEANRQLEDACLASIQHEQERNAERAARVAAEQDAARLLWIVKDAGVDQIGEIDLHEEASIAASVFARDEPNDNDYISALRTAIDAAQREVAND